MFGETSICFPFFGGLPGSAPLPLRSFQSTMKALENLSGYEESDVKAALIVEDDADQAGAQLTIF